MIMEKFSAFSKITAACLSASLLISGVNGRCAENDILIKKKQLEVSDEKKRAKVPNAVGRPRTTEENIAFAIMSIGIGSFAGFLLGRNSLSKVLEDTESALQWECILMDRLLHDERFAVGSDLFDRLWYEMGYPFGHKDGHLSQIMVDGKKALTEAFYDLSNISQNTENTDGTASAETLERGLRLLELAAVFNQMYRCLGIDRENLLSSVSEEGKKMAEGDQPLSVLIKSLNEIARLPRYKDKKMDWPWNETDSAIRSAKALESGNKKRLVKLDIKVFSRTSDFFVYFAAIDLKKSGYSHPTEND